MVEAKDRAEHGRTGRLAGKYIAVTGTSRGLGRALATAFSAEGARVVAHARESAGAARVPGGIVVGGDLRDATLGPRLASVARAELGHLDALVLNAGVLGPMQPLVDTDFELFREVMEINVDAQLRLFVACLPLLLARPGGAVVWLSSGLGRFGLPRYGAYGAAKHAVEGLMKIAAAEHGPDGLVSLAVAPGMVETDMLASAIGPHEAGSFKAPAEAAEQFVTLLASLDPALNGQSIDVGTLAPAG